MKIKIFSILFVTIFAASLNTISAGGNAHYFSDKNGIAIKGYDLVSYFTAYKAVKGDKKYSVKYDNSTFYFANAKHQKMFEQNPEKYLPKYGGYCAFAMGMKNAKVPSDPQTFKIVNGKLYLFFNDLYNGKKFNTIIPWNNNEINIRKKADANFSKMQKK